MASFSRRGFTGHRHNDALGLIYMNARYYLPGISRFVSADTLVPEPADPQSMNRYSYALNNPIKYTDPSGHLICRVGEGRCKNPISFAPINIQTGVGWIDWTSRQLVNLGCATLGGWCRVEAGSIAPASALEWAQNQDLMALATPLSISGSGIVNYGGRNYIAEHLEKVLTRGERYALNARGEVVERLAGAVKEYDVIRYGSRTLRRESGMEAHHGVMNAWFEANKIPGYRSSNAPAMMLDPSDHAMTVQIFNDWAAERFGNVRNIDWTVIAPDEMMGLAKRMFDAAGVPQRAQNNYFVTFWHYINSLGP